MGYDIFVSYSTKDKLFADALVNRLESSKVRCWYTPRDIPAGTTWPSAIASAIKQTPIMLLIFSGSSNDSQEVSRELTLASTHKCLVIPVRIENVMPSQELEYHLTNRHWLDVHNLELEAAIDQVMEGIDRYRTLFQEPPARDRESPAPRTETTPTNQMGQKSRKAPFPLRRYAILFLLACVVVAVMMYAQYKNGTLGQPNDGLRAAKNAAIYLYADNAGVEAAVLRLESAAPEEEYLVRVSGMDGSFSGHIFRCALTLRYDEKRLATNINGEPFVLLILDAIKATAYQPDSQRQYALTYTDKSADLSAIIKFLNTYRAQEKAGLSSAE